MDPFRLDSVAPAVAERFRQAPANRRRQAVLVACEYAATVVGLTEREVGQALDVLREAVSPDPSLRERLERAAAELDDGYLRLNEEGEPARKQEAVRLFSKARATSALAFALSTDEAQLHEALYEAIAAVDDPGHMTRLVEGALG